MSKNEELKNVTVELDGKKMTDQWNKQLEDDLLAYHGFNIEDELLKMLKHEMIREQMRRDIDAIVHPLLSDPMDMNGMCATTDKIMKVFEKYKSMTEAAQKYFELYYKLVRYIENGESNSEKADTLRDQMDEYWYKMTDKERELLDIVGKKPIISGDEKLI